MRKFLTALSVSVVLGAAPAVMAGEFDADARDGKGGGCSYGHETVKNDFETPPPAASAVKPKPQG